ncbi:MAG TPA: hypothetical protein VFS25_19485, partial [Chitinophaga sp.]|uniref:hypothetical protein n=1 Tax=Chitinophaga sp. TaxID=1869181 RepID=UPI002DB82E7E
MPYHENVLTVGYKLVCFAVMSLFLLSGYAASAQATDSTAMAAAQLPGKYFKQVAGKSKHMEQQVDKRTAKALQRLQR